MRLFLRDYSFEFFLLILFFLRLFSFLGFLMGRKLRLDMRWHKVAGIQQMQNVISVLPLGV